MNPEEFQKMYEQEKSHWWYKARGAWLSYVLEKKIPFSPPLQMLDLASALGGNFHLCTPFGSINGIDISDLSLFFCRQKGIKEIVKGDVEKLPFLENSFHVIIALDVFEHLKSDENCMREIFRTLKPGGILIFNIPSFQSMFSNHDRSFHHIRRYKRKKLEKKLINAGFQVNFMSYWSFFIFPFVFLLRTLFQKNVKQNEVATSDFHFVLPHLVDKWLLFFSKIEFWLISNGVSLPCGVSLLGYASKPGNIST